MLVAVTDENGKRKAPGVRARVRAELTAEIKRSARDQLAAEGAGSLSLRAIARELGMASSAIYRYFASRDELLTALIIDAYNAAGELVERADTGCRPDDHRGRFIAMSTALRQWAIANPHQYALIYGSPVPGYAAPQDTIDPATRVPIALLTVLVEARRQHPPSTDPLRDEALRAALADLIGYTDDTIEPATAAVGVEMWGELFGLISLELFGHFNNVVTDPDAFFDHAIRSMADRLLGGPALRHRS